MLFKKAAVATDIHLGLKSNSQVHNQDCVNYINWFIDKAKHENCDTGIFLGDWLNNRNSVNINTMKISIDCLEKLGSSFEQFFFILGNHDLYWKDRRDLHSSEFGKFIPGITVINDIKKIDDVIFCPWLVKDEWKKIKKLKGQYIFGHFELPNFLMNASIMMPNHNEIQPEHFGEFEYVFSGHFHKRQSQYNIHYIGNCFPHNYSDIGDNNRGMMILEHGKEPQYYNWEQCPKYKLCLLSDLLEDIPKYAEKNTYLKTYMDTEISFEESFYIKEMLIEQYNIREINFLPIKKTYEDVAELEIEKFESVDQIVTGELINIQSETFDNRILLGIYNLL